MTQDIVFILFYFILLLFQSEETTAMTLRTSQNDGPDSPKKCHHCDGPPEKSKKDTRINFAKEKKSKYFQKLHNNFYKYKYSEKPRYDHFLSKGWGAAGMPFNVLYTPNAYQQKILKSVPRREQPGRYTQPRKHVPEVYNLVLEAEKPPPRAKQSLTKSQHSPRKYYSLIPQLFVSYGW